VLHVLIVGAVPLVPVGVAVVTMRSVVAVLGTMPMRTAARPAVRPRGQFVETNSQEAEANQTRRQNSPEGRHARGPFLRLVGARHKKP
jgi:hypothetical protein